MPVAGRAAYHPQHDAAEGVNVAVLVYPGVDEGEVGTVLSTFATVTRHAPGQLQEAVLYEECFVDLPLLVAGKAAPAREDAHGIQTR